MSNAIFDENLDIAVLPKAKFSQLAPQLESHFSAFECLRPIAVALIANPKDEELALRLHETLNEIFDLPDQIAPELAEQLLARLESVYLEVLELS